MQPPDSGDIPPPPLSTIRTGSFGAAPPPSRPISRVQSTNTAASLDGPHHSLRSNSIRGSVKLKETTMTFLRGIMGQRNQDYVSDQPLSYPSAAFRASAAPTRVPSSSGRGIDEDVPDDAPAAAMSLRKPRLWRFLNTTLYKTLLIVATIILLFGAEFRDLVPLADAAMDYVFAVVLVFFLVDMGLRCDAESQYFGLHCGRNCHYQSGDDEEASSQPLFQMGSFLFWCDVISTLTLLREITWFDLEGNFDEQHIDVQLNQWGMPKEVCSLHTIAFCTNLHPPSSLDVVWSTKLSRSNTIHST